MKERNICKEAGCSAACCRDAYFNGSYSVKNVLRWFPEATKVWDITKPTEGGVYYSSFLGIAGVRIVGPCPNLNTDQECSVYDIRPRDCENIKRSSKECSLFRRVQEQGIKISSFLSAPKS